MNKIFKYIICTLAVILCGFSFTFNVSATSINKIENSSILAYEPEDLTGITSNNNANSDDKCDAIFGDPKDKEDPAYWMQWILNVMKYIAIVALLALVTMDFFKALVSNDKDALKKAGSTAAKRFIYCVMIFFLPIIVDLIMSLFGAYGTCGIG